MKELNLDKKKAVIDSLHEKLAKSAIVIATDYKGLDVAAVTQLRAELTKAGVEFQVAKNTLLRRASVETDAALIADSFKGPTAIAISFDDPVAPAKILTKFVEDNDKLQIKAAVMEGKLLDIEGIKALSSLPSREVLLSQLLATMNAVPTGMVRVLAEMPRQMLNVLSAIKDQKEAA
ncbi:50S ribosomal protein L10 [Desulfoluna sp.]|uniref:50S ribosomal protein L10 n=1 Tax=Desulfoluna sp. TaxID=2045199 RepID=UPI00345826BC